MRRSRSAHGCEMKTKNSANWHGLPCNSWAAAMRAARLNTFNPMGVGDVFPRHRCAFHFVAVLVSRDARGVTPFGFYAGRNKALKGERNPLERTHRGRHHQQTNGPHVPTN